jgi:pyruvate ferredoxin oxidoreductase gamma subunit
MWFLRKKAAPPEQRQRVAVRFEAIGGQGANSAGKILAEAAVLGMGFTGNHFSSFGSEKRGSPVRSFVRFSPALHKTRSASSIRRPDLLAVFHENLLSSHQEVLEGAGEGTDLVLNSLAKPADLRFPRTATFRRVATLDANRIARKSGAGINAVMLGAASVFLPEIASSRLAETLEKFFAKLSAEARKGNLAGFAAGRESVVIADFNPTQAALDPAHSPLPRLGFLNAPLGGLINNPGNSVLKDNSASRRGVAPRLYKDVCFHCGFCDMVCPDYCFVWDRTKPEMPRLQGIDYRFCKGCQKCIVACPVEALVPVPEQELTESELGAKLFPEADSAAVEARWRGTDWPHFLAELSNEERMLTLQTELLDPKSYLRPDFSAWLKKKTDGEK